VQKVNFFTEKIRNTPEFFNLNEMNPHLQNHQRKSIRLKGYDYSKEGLYFITICVQTRASLFGMVQNGAMILNDAGKMVEKWYYELENKYPDKRCHEMVVMPNHFHCIIENVSTDAIDARVSDATDARVSGVTDARVSDATDAHVSGVTDAHVSGVTDAHVSGVTDAHVSGVTDAHVSGVTDAHVSGVTDAHVSGVTDAHVSGVTDAHAGAPLRGRPRTPTTGHSPYGIHNQKYNASIGDAMDWFKTMTTNEYIRGVKQFGWRRFYKKLWQRNYYERIIRDEKSYKIISKYIENNPDNWGNDKFKKPMH
jgi:putative transposase